MIIFLYGPDTYRSRQKLREIVEHYKKIHKTGLNLMHWEGLPAGRQGEKLSFSDFREKFQTPSLFKGARLAVVKNAFSNWEFKQDFLKNISDFKDSKNVVLFYEEESPAPNDKFFQALKKHGRCQVFNPLQGEGLRDWVRKEIGQYGKQISPAALNQLLSSLGNDLWRLSNELKKLASYQSGKRVDSDDLRLLVKPEIEADIFKTIEALASGDKKRALYLTHKHLERGDYPLYLLTMINFQFRNLLVIKSESTNDIRMPRINNISKKLGMHPYVVKKSLAQAQKFSLEELKKIYQKIFQADLDIKTGRIDPETALDLLIAEI